MQVSVFLTTLRNTGPKPTILPQEVKDPGTEAESVAMEERIKAIQSDIATAQVEHERLATILKRLREQRPTSDELRESVHELQLERRKLLERLQPLQDMQALRKTEAEQEVDLEWALTMLEVDRLKRMFQRLWAIVGGGFHKGYNRGQLWVSG